MPLGCRWCGHPPYAHEAASLPHRPGHEWEQPTPAQVDARLSARRRLGLDGRLPTVMPVRPLPRREPYGISHEPYRVPLESHVALAGRHRRTAEPTTAVAVPYRRGRPPGTRVPPGEREPYRQRVAA
ncbi:hypothetical protein ACOZ38_01360 [Sphaerisporangium viridialbum]|uniref:hypothetical protein n=1 Tax=Sphaerisporangium viridialbum TaxID=46189 RepID=UPI003C7667D4